MYVELISQPCRLLKFGVETTGCRQLGKATWCWLLLCLYCRRLCLSGSFRRSGVMLSGWNVDFLISNAARWWFHSQRHQWYLYRKLTMKTANQPEIANYCWYSHNNNSNGSTENYKAHVNIMTLYDHHPPNVWISFWKCYRMYLIRTQFKFFVKFN